MVSEAMDERQKAEELVKEGGRPQNHRNFNVSCSVMGINEADRAWAIFTKPNTMPKPRSSKVCAETRALGAARKARMGLIIGMVVVGEPQADGGSGYEAETLWCCEICRLNHLGKDTQDDTLIATMRPDKPRGQIQTAKEMVDFQSAIVLGEEPDEIASFPYLGEKRWDTARSRYEQMVPRGVDTLFSAENRLLAVDAARMAISGLVLVK